MSPASDRTVVRRTAAIFGVVTVLAGLLNVLPQTWLMERYPESRSALLSALLLGGTFTSMLGVFASRTVLRRHGGLTRTSLVTVVLAIVVLTGALFGDGLTLLIYGVVFCTCRFVIYFFINHIDQTLAASVGPEQARRHAGGIVVFQLLGSVVGPLAFAMLVDAPGLAWGVVGLLAVAMIVPPWDALPRSPAPLPEPQRPADAAGTEGNPVGVFYLFCTLCLVSVFGLGAQIVYVLERHVQVDDPTRWGGVLLAVVAASAGVAVVAGMRRRGERAPGHMMVVGALWLAACLGLVLPGPPLWLMALASVGGGVGYGVFLLATRAVATAWQGPPGRQAVLSTYNNLTNFASLVAYGLIGVLGVTMGDGHPWFSVVLLACLLITSVAAVGVGLYWRAIAHEAQPAPH